MRRNYIILFWLLGLYGAYAQPNSVTTGAATNINVNEATLNGIVGKRAFVDAPTTDYYFEYGTASDLTGASTTSTTQLNNALLAEDEAVVVGINSLSAETRYYYRLNASEGGPSVPGTIESFYTFSNVFAGDIQDFKIRTNSTTSIHLEWTAETTNNDGYLILYTTGSTAPDAATDILNGIAPASQTISGGISSEIVTGSSTDNVNITGLTVGTEYSFSIIPFNSDGTNDATYNYNVASYSTLSGFTQVAEPSNNVANISHISGENNIELTFDKSDGAVPADGYFITYRQNSSAPSNPFSGIDGTAGTAELDQANTDGTFTFFSAANLVVADISGLSPATVYSFRVIAFSSEPGQDTTSFNYKTNGVTYTNEYTLSTEPTASISNFQRTGATTSQINFSFDTYAFSGNGGFVLYYQAGSVAPDLTGVEDGIHPDNQTTAPAFYTFEPDDAAVTISSSGNISPGTEYTFVLIPYQSLSTVDATLNFRTSSPATISTWSLSDEPSGEIPDNANFIVDNPTANSFDIAYDAVTADGYIAIYGTTAFDETELTDAIAPASQSVTNGTVVDLGNVTSATISGLLANTAYEVVVIPYRVADDGGPVAETYNYFTANATTKSISTICSPPANQASFTGGTPTATTIDLSWNTVAGADSYLVLAKEAADVDFTPVSGVSYTGNADYLAANTLGASNKVLLSGAYPTQPYTITNLTPNTEYRFAIFAYNSADDCYNTVAPGTLTVTTSSPSSNNTLAIVNTAATINSITNDVNNNFITALTFDIIDGGVDNANTFLLGFDITAGASDYFASNGVNWIEIIAEARLVNTTPTTDVIKTLTISPTGNTLSVAIASNENNNANQFGYIAEAGSIRMELQIKLRDDITVSQIDSKNFSFEINPASISTEGSSSGFDTSGGTTITSDPAQNQIEVEASKFSFFTQPPASINAGENMIPQPIIAARDANNNLDLDFSGAFTVTNTDAIPMNNSPTSGFSNGTFTFPNNFNYQGSGQGNLTLTSGAVTGTSSFVNVRPTITVAASNTGLNAGTLQSGTTDQAVVGLSIDALGSATLDDIIFNIDATTAGKLSNFKFYQSVNNQFDGVGSETLLNPTITVDNGAGTVTVSGLSSSFATETKYFYLTADVSNTVNSFDTPDLTFSLDQLDLTFTETVNIPTFSINKLYSFEDITNPEVNTLAPEFSVISDSDIPGTYSLTITFNEEMDGVTDPVISFPTENPGASLSFQSASSSWSVSNSVYTAVFNVSDQNLDLQNIDVRISGAVDKSGNTQILYNEADVFGIDTRNPTVNIGLDNTLITIVNNTLTLTATFDEEMNPAVTPIFTVSGSTNLTTQGAGSWSGANTIYTQVFEHNLTEEELAINSIEVSAAVDLLGNVMVTKSSANFQIDTEPAKILNISSPTSNGLKKPGDLIVITVNFDDNISVTGSPYLELNAGAAIATFASVSGSTVNFNYTVGAVNSGENTLDLNVENLVLNGGQIDDLNANEANLTLPAAPNRLIDNKDIQVDTKPATITSVSSASTQYFNEGDLVVITVTFDEAVNVIGTPTLALNSGGQANYSAGTGTSSLTFNYLVQASENSADLDYLDVNSLTAGTSIRDNAQIDVIRTLPAVGGPNSLASNSVIVIDTENPVLALLEPLRPANDSLNVSHTNPFSLEFAEPVNGSGTANIRLIRFDDDQLIATYDGNSFFANGAGTSILSSISLEADIADTTQYYFEFDGGAVVDLAGNAYAGFSGNATWSFTSAGPARIDDFSVAACVGENFTIQGEYFTGVTQIITGSGANTTTYSQGDFSVNADGTEINFIVLANTESGNISLNKISGESNNTEAFSTTSDTGILVGPSSAQLEIVNFPDVCNSSAGGAPDEVELRINVVGGSSVYNVILNNGVADTLITGYNNSSSLFLTPPNIGINTYTLVAVTDDDANLSSCGAPNLGSTVDVVKYERSQVQAGGAAIDTETGYGLISICTATDDRVDLSDALVMGTTPSIVGDVATGVWTIIGGGAGSGGFNVAKSQKTSTSIQPTYYFSLDDVARGEVILELTSDDPSGNNPCTAASDRLIIRFASSSQATPVSASINVCEEVQGGALVAIAPLQAVLSSGATDLLWTRPTDAETPLHDGSWGFADTEDAVTFTLSTTTQNPFYKASPQELANNFAQLEVQATAGSCGGVSDPVGLDINISNLPVPTKSSSSNVNPVEVCSGESGVSFRLNPSSNTSRFIWSITNSGVDTPGTNDKNEITTSSIAGSYGASIQIDFRDVDVDTPETITVYEIDNGCSSEILSFDVTIKGQVIANILNGPSSTINNSTTNLQLIGEGGYVGDLKVGGTFSGQGVVETSDGRFLLNTVDLTPTNVNDSLDDYIIIYTYETDDGNACPATDIIKFDVFDEENSFPDLDAVYCESDSAITINLNTAVLGDNIIVTDIYISNNTGEKGVVFLQPDSTNYAATFDPALALIENGNNPNITVKYATENTLTGEINLEAGSQSVIVNPLPDVAPQLLNQSYCSDEGEIFLNRDEAVNPNNSFTFSLLNEDLPSDLDLLVFTPSPKSYKLDLTVLPDYLEQNNLDSLHLQLLYSYTSDQGCINYDTLKTVVYKIPEEPLVDRSILAFVVNNNQRDTVYTARVTNVDEALEVYWFPDLSNLNPAGAINEGPTFNPNIDISRETATYYAVRFDKGCESEVTPVTYYRLEPPTFSWDKSVFGAGSPISFTADDRNEANPQINIDSRTWSIAKDGQNLTIPVADQGGNSLSYQFTEAESYTVTYTVRDSGKDLAISTSEVMIAIPAQSALSYNFNSGSNGWQHVSTHGAESSWENGVPTVGFENEDAAWVTNLDGNYISREKSYLYSPAFDISSVEKPVLSFDLWLDLAGNDGLIIEYTVDDLRIEDSEKEWRTLGRLASGLNWYNSNELDLEDIGFGIGWSDNLGEVSTAVNAKHILDDIKLSENGGGQVVFRFRLSSNSSTVSNGVAIDNFAIESRNRNILIEYFGSLSSVDTVQQNALIQNANADISWINYRVNPSDVFNRYATSDIVTRSYFYNVIGDENDFVLDGDYQRELLFSENTESISRRALVSSIFELGVDAAPSTDNGSLDITASVQLIGNTEIPANTHLMVAVINSELNIDGTTRFNVLQDFLPTAQGLKITESGNYSFNYTPRSVEEASNLKVIAFLQRFGDNNLKSIYQAANTLEPITLTNVVTGIDTKLLRNLRLYPNPANTYATFSFNPLGETAKIRMFDVQGRLVLEDQIDAYQSNMEINTSSFASGLYTLIISNDKGSISQLKLSVKH